MIIVDINHIDRDSWQQLLNESPVASWFQTQEAYEFFSSLPQMMKPFVFAVTDSGNKQLKGVVVGYVTQEKNPIKQYFTRRAIIYGGPLLAEDIEDEELKSLLLALLSYLKKKAIYVETRNFSDYSRWRKVFEECGFSYQPHYDIHIDCSNRSKMQERIADGKRRNIRQTLAEDIELKETENEVEVEEYYHLLADLYKTKVHKPLFPLSFFTTFVKKHIGVLLVAKKNNTVIGGMLCAILPSKVLYEWYVVGPAIVTWAAMDYANRNGLQMFDFMGAGEPARPYGVRDFKMQFGGELLELGRFLHINNPCLYSIGKAYMAKIAEPKI